MIFNSEILASCIADYLYNLISISDGIFLVEVDRLLRPGGYFVWTSSLNTHRMLREKENQKKWLAIKDFTESICWELLSQQEETVVWKKTSSKKCYSLK